MTVCFMSSQWAAFTLDGHLSNASLTKAPALLRVRDGVLHLPEGPGIGVEPDPAKLERWSAGQVNVG
jgi:L-alanine-DL-glutamate epimerase-like enolase superfamily enzyme